MSTLRLEPHDEALRELITLHGIRQQQIEQYTRMGQIDDAVKCAERADNLRFTIDFLRNEQLRLHPVRTAIEKQKEIEHERTDKPKCGT